MQNIESAIVTINFGKLIEYEDCKPMLKHIRSVVTRETGIKPKIEIITVKFDK